MLRRQPQIGNDIGVAPQVEDSPIPGHTRGNIPVPRTGGENSHARTRTASRGSAPVPAQMPDNVPAPADVVEDVEVEVCEMDDVVEKMRKWEQVGLSKKGISRLEPGELSEAMASYMLRYRVAWKQKLTPLKTCLHKLFNDDLLVGEDLVGLSAENIKELQDDITPAMAADPTVGAKTGLIIAAERFLRQLA